MKKLGSVLVAVAASALAVPTLSSPASAAVGDVTVQVTVVDADGSPIKGVYVSLENDYEYLDLGYTDEQGSLIASEDLDELPIGDGEWDVLLNDYDDAREAAGTTYVSSTIEGVTLAEGDNPLGPYTLQKGAVVTGVVKAPSGRPIKDIFVGAKKGDFYDAFSPTSSAGAFRLVGVGTGTYMIRAARVSLMSQFGNEPAKTNSVFTITEPGQSVVAPTVLKHQVDCSTKSFSVSSPKKGKAKLTVRASAPYVGLTNPWGKITVKKGSKTVKTFDVKKGGAGKSLTATISATKGKKATFKATYSGGDCLTWSSTKTVTIKKK